MRHTLRSLTSELRAPVSLPCISLILFLHAISFTQYIGILKSMGTSASIHEQSFLHVLPRPQVETGPRRADTPRNLTPGLPRPQMQDTTPASLQHLQLQSSALPRPEIPRPKSSCHDRSRSPVPLELDFRFQSKNTTSPCDGNQLNAVIRRQREQTKLLRARKPSENSQLMTMWLQILTGLGSLSSIFTEIQDSPNRLKLAGIILDSFAASTLFRYFSCMSKFLQIYGNLQVRLEQFTAVQLLDVFLIGSKRTGLDPSMTLKALNWFHVHAGVAQFEITSHALVRSWRNSKVPKDRRESLPLPLYVVVQWERRLLQAGCTSTEHLVLGGFLLMIWSGLRFADLQRITHSSLMASFSEIRGLCWRTKTCSKGQLWGLAASGFLSNGEFSWSMQFLQHWDHLFGTQPSEDTDFLIPSCTLEGPIIPLQAMSYVEALGWFRRWLSIQWRKSSLCANIDTMSYSIHGMKATLLSWGAQLGHKGVITDEMRRLQGHHKPSQASVSLYSRDDVGSQLEFHARLVAQIKQGWRPITPQHRGGQAPCGEPHVEIEQFKKDTPPYVWKVIHFYSNAMQPASIEIDDVSQQGDSSSASSEASSDLSSDGSWSEVEEPDMPSAQLLALGNHRHTIHAMIQADKAGRKGVHFLGVALKTGCGLYFTGDRISILEMSASLEGLVACNHRGCNKLIANLFE